MVVLNDVFTIDEDLTCICFMDDFMLQDVSLWFLCPPFHEKLQNANMWRRKKTCSNLVSLAWPAFFVMKNWAEVPVTRSFYCKRVLLAEKHEDINQRKAFMILNISLLNSSYRIE